MDIGIPKESKVLEGRVGLVPAAASDLTAKGHNVFVETNAGLLSGFNDTEYEQAGCVVVNSFEEVVEKAKLIVKVKEPSLQEVSLCGKAHIFFCYLHLAALPELTAALQDKKLTAIAFETVTDSNGRLPLLAPMSQIAGTLAVQNAATLLHQVNGGAGVLIGGISATTRSNVVVLGCGSAGYAAAELAAKMGANVIVFDKIIERLEAARRIGANVTAIYPYQATVNDAVVAADVVIGAVLIPGVKAPRVVAKSTVEQMRPGSVIVDIAIDQGGCIETMEPTDYRQPTFSVAEVIHFGVTNMPGAVPRTASEALSAAIAPYVEKLTQKGWEQDKNLANGINVKGGSIVHPGLKQSLADH